MATPGRDAVNRKAHVSRETRFAKKSRRARVLPAPPSRLPSRQDL